MARKNAKKSLQTAALETLNDNALNEVVGGSKGGGRVSVRDLNITKFVDKSSPILFL
jgi:bacteriocin-like protein